MTTETIELKPRTATPPPAPCVLEGFQLTAGDVEILKLVLEFRLLRIDHLAALTGRSYKKLHGRLFKLVGRRYLSRIELPLQKHIYVLGKAGVPVLVEQGLAPKELLEWRLRHHELKELFLKHQMMVVDFHTALAVAAGDGPVKLVAWKEGQALWNTVSVRIDGAREELPVRPDAFFTLEDTTRPAGQNQVHFFLEADRSTTTHRRFERKLTAYWHYFQDGGHTAKHGIRTFRVVAVTLTAERARNLCAAAVDIP
jgi:hypothetical protein